MTGSEGGVPEVAVGVGEGDGVREGWTRVGSGEGSGVGVDDGEIISGGCVNDASAVSVGVDERTPHAETNPKQHKRHRIINNFDKIRDFLADVI
jgi:hypothetical protein